MREKVNAKFLKLALEMMNEDQLKYFAVELDERTEYLKTKLMEHELSEEDSSNTKEEYAALKEIRSKFIIDLTIAKF
jgi:hypothetical protein